MKTIDVIQGTPEWAALRTQYCCASEAPVVMGVSSHMRRDELLAMKKYGIEKNISDYIQKVLFDKGHEAEDAIRPHIESLISEDLYPVTGIAEILGLPLLASFDGLTMGEDIAAEHKLWNESLVMDVQTGIVPTHHAWQIEHQLLVSGAEKALFAVSDGTPDKFVHCWYESVPERRQSLLAAWKQFLIDLENYQHVEVLPAPVAEPVMSLPSVSVQVQGSLAVISNLALFGEKLTAFVANIDKNPSDDQAFANAESAIRTLQAAQDALEAAEAAALAQTSSIDEMRRTVAMYSKTARDTRLMLEKLVKARKETVRAELVDDARKQITIHLQSLNKSLGAQYIISHVAVFESVIKGKKTIVSIRSALNDEVARAKIAANEVAETIRANLKTLDSLADYKFLFRDLNTLLLKTPDDFELVAETRVNAHKLEEQRKLDAERERIREEEREKAEAEARECADRETADRQAREEANISAAMEAETQQDAVAQDEGLQRTVAQTKAHTTFQGMSAAKKGPTCPTDDAILMTIAHAYNVDYRTAKSWVADMAARIKVA